MQEENPAIAANCSEPMWPVGGTLDWWHRLACASSVPYSWRWWVGNQKVEMEEP